MMPSPPKASHIVSCGRREEDGLRAFSWMPGERRTYGSIFSAAGDDPLFALATAAITRYESSATALKVLRRMIAAAEQLVQHLMPHEEGIVHLLARKQNPMDTV